MNEQRTQAYLNLINQLLSCNDGDEPRIVQENRELLDEGLVQVMVALAQQYENAGRENEAQWLIYIAQQLAEDLEIWSDETTEKVNTDQDYLTFFGEVLQLLTNDPDMNIKIIYPFFEKNLDKLDENLIAVLDNFVRNILLPSADSETAITITASIVNFSRLIQEFPHGDISMNQEIAIAGNELVLTIDDDPIDRALTQNNLGIAYRNRIKGDKAENLEIAISLYNEALRIRTFDAFPQNWAATQNNLANVYRERIMGDKADNLDKAIATYTEVLKVYTFDAFPKQWAEIQNNLALAYSDRIRGEKAENLERAIATYKEVLKVYTFDSFPEKWAYIQNLLGATYIERIKGNKVENLEQAIAACNEALKVYTIETFPQDWAMTQNRLALAYSYRILGDKDDNIEKAINTYAVAEQVITFDTDSESWAIIQNNLGIAYYERIRGDKAENLEKALEVYESSLKIRTFEQFPEYWADTQHNIGNTYRQRIKGDKAENIEKSIEAYTNALKVRTFENSPLLWAETRNSLGNAYCQRKVGNKAENLKKAITLFTDALKIWTNENNLFSCLMVASNLANLYYNEEQWQPATEAYHIAIEAVENARLEALNPRSREQTLSHAIEVFHRIVLAYLNLNQPEKALEYIERSKGRNLVELITQKNLQPQGVSQEIIAQLNELKQRVVNEQIRLQHQSINQNLMRSDNLTPYVPDHSYLKEYQQDLDNFIAREIKDPLFNLTQKVEPILFTEIQELTDAETCLLQWYITGEKILAFVVSAEGEVKVWQSSEDDVKQLFDTINNYLQLYYSDNRKQEWRNKLSNLLQTFADTLHINDILALIPDTCQRLIIIPYVYLHILPIHAFPINKNQILQDKYDVQYAPSCQILQKISQTFHHSDFNKLFAIQNPTKDLSYTDLEVNILSTFFTEPQVIAQDNATKNAVLPHLKSSDNHCYHFSCHGSFNPDNPLESALFLANKEPLTLGEIFELRLHKCRLIILSACETGMIDINSISDEYIGLPSGFLFAGSPSVVSSLWTVNDLSTSFLMIKLYEILFDENQQVSVPVALKTAQNWLQNLTIEELDKFLEQYQPQMDKHLALLQPEQRPLYKESLKQIKQRKPHPFISPYYWAGFIATGI
jgi:CHAT domain-containing protein